jgi:hypothetical protein
MNCRECFDANITDANFGHSPSLLRLGATFVRLSALSASVAQGPRGTAVTSVIDLLPFYRPSLHACR